MIETFEFDGIEYVKSEDFDRVDAALSAENDRLEAESAALRQRVEALEKILKPMASSEITPQNAYATSIFIKGLAKEAIKDTK